MEEDFQRMLVCEVCGATSCFGFGVTLEGVRMGDMGSWRCSEHHPTRNASYTREDWAQATAAGKLYPNDEVVVELKSYVRSTINA
jgi:hypothetical protein